MVKLIEPKIVIQHYDFRKPFNFITANRATYPALPYNVYNMAARIRNEVTRRLMMGAIMQAVNDEVWRTQDEHN